jgi:acetyltransferase-like isoleucine patch superfamily enzyme
MANSLSSILDSCRRCSDPLVRAIQKKLWLAQLQPRGVRVHPSIEITGRKYFRDFVKMERGCHISRDCTLWIAGEPDSKPMLELGKIHVDRNCYIGVYAPISIGDDTIIGAYSYIISGNHRIAAREIPVREQGYDGAPIAIGRDVWLGCHVVVLPGVKIGDCAVVAAGAVATKSIPPGEIWGGVPARKIGMR